MAPASGSNSVWKRQDPHLSMYVICRDMVVADVLKAGGVDAVALHVVYVIYDIHFLAVLCSCRHDKYHAEIACDL